MTKQYYSSDVHTSLFAYAVRKAQSKSGNGMSRYIPSPAIIDLFDLKRGTQNNRKESNGRGANPRRLKAQRIPRQILAPGVHEGKTVVVAVKTNELKKVYHTRPISPSHLPFVSV